MRVCVRESLCFVAPLSRSLSNLEMCSRATLSVSSVCGTQGARRRERRLDDRAARVLLVQSLVRFAHQRERENAPPFFPSASRESQENTHPEEKKGRKTLYLFGRRVRHYPTTDVAVESMEAPFRAELEGVVRSRVLPLLADVFLQRVARGASWAVRGDAAVRDATRRLEARRRSREIRRRAARVFAARVVPF